MTCAEAGKNYSRKWTRARCLHRYSSFVPDSERLDSALPIRKSGM